MHVLQWSIVLGSFAMVLCVVDASEDFRWGSLQVGDCLSTCCCKVCSAPSAQAYPYGLLDLTSGANPLNPVVIGATCRVPIWSDQVGVRDSSNALVTPPDTLWWADFDVFGDTAQKTAPLSCDCCQRSVDTNCAEEAPIATVPSHFRVGGGGEAVAGQVGSVVFEEGIGLSTLDFVELRNDTFCGYYPPRAMRRSVLGDLTPATDATSNTWSVEMPAAGCYRVCYYLQNLTTPGWYHVGNLVVHPAPAVGMSVEVDPHDTLLGGNTVTLTFSGLNLLSVFDDEAELRTAGACGSGSPTTTTGDGSNGQLDVLEDADWCHPSVVPQITDVRPLRLIAVAYGDCPAAQRLFLAQLKWSLTLPSPGTDTTYTVCYRTSGTWATAGTILVPAVLTQEAALNALYTATGGANWRYNANWGGPSACTYHGIRCDESGNVISVLLGRNNLVGSVPVDFFRGTYYQHVQDVKLDMNQLSGAFPPEVGAFRKLRALDISHNDFTGTLPITLTRGDLQILYVTANGFSGDVTYELTALSQRWEGGTDLVDEPEPPIVHACPTPIEECSDRGTSEDGVNACGYDGITEEECLVRGCCFNAQAPLTFGGTACFTKRAITYETHPPCQNGNVFCQPLTVSSDDS